MESNSEFFNSNKSEIQQDQNNLRETIFKFRINLHADDKIRVIFLQSFHFNQCFVENYSENSETAEL